MFNCQNCKKQQPAGQPVNYIVIERRVKFYDKPIIKRRDGEKRIVGWDKDGIESWEIAKEIKVCPQCFRSLTGREPKMQTSLTPKPKRAQGFNRQPPRKKWKNPKDNKKGGYKQQTLGALSPKKKKGPIVERVNRQKS